MPNAKHYIKTYRIDAPVPIRGPILEGLLGEFLVDFVATLEGKYKTAQGKPKGDFNLAKYIALVRDFESRWRAIDKASVTTGRDAFPEYLWESRILPDLEYRALIEFPDLKAKYDVISSYSPEELEKYLITNGIPVRSISRLEHLGRLDGSYRRFHHPKPFTVKYFDVLVSTAMRKYESLYLQEYSKLVKEQDAQRTAYERAREEYIKRRENYYRNFWAQHFGLQLSPNASYQYLGIKPGCGLEEATASYRAMALTHHPDTPGGSTEKFQELTSHYSRICSFIG